MRKGAVSFRRSEQRLRVDCGIEFRIQISFVSCRFRCSGKEMVHSGVFARAPLTVPLEERVKSGASKSFLPNSLFTGRKNN